MKKRIIPIWLALAIFFNCIPTYAMANVGSQGSGAISISELDAIEDKSNLYIVEGKLTRDSEVFLTTIMQGNTYSASDCRVMLNRLSDSNHGYEAFMTYGWTSSSDIPKNQRVTADEFKSSGDSAVAYYSGHGGTTDSNGKKYPILNFTPSNPSSDYGVSSPFNVASLLGVDSDSNWQSNCYFKPTDNLRVLLLASCSQLDSSIVKYYARIMKASGIRAIAGYHDTAPSNGDDTIASLFIDYADAGNSIWYSWQHANTGYNWAVLVYQENANQYYRLPGFPGKTYDPPSSSATVYRYASFLSAPQATPVAIDQPIEDQITSLPLTLTTTEHKERSLPVSSEREVVISDVSIPDNDDIIQTYFSNGEESSLLDTICVQHYVTREQVDEGGIVAATATVIERTYDYYDTYQGIKIADSYVGASIDSEGLKNIIDLRKEVASSGNSVNTLNENSSEKVTLISKDEAVKIALNENTSNEEVELYNVSLAYAPVGNGEHVLCYEVMFSYGFCYVNVQTGEIVSLI